jgi:excisionase family DNA binding protein
MSIATEPRNTLSIEQAAEVLGISRTLAYEAARSGFLAGVPVLRVGRRLLVPRAALERVLAGERLPGQDPTGR